MRVGAGVGVRVIVRFRFRARVRVRVRIRVRVRVRDDGRADHQKGDEAILHLEHGLHAGVEAIDRVRDRRHLVRVRGRVRGKGEG